MYIYVVVIKSKDNNTTGSAKTRSCPQTAWSQNAAFKITLQALPLFRVAKVIKIILKQWHPQALTAVNYNLHYNYCTRYTTFND